MSGLTEFIYNYFREIFEVDTSVFILGAGSEINEGYQPENSNLDPENPPRGGKA